MPTEDERTLQIRRMLGINQAIDARISEPGTFRATKNYYAKRVGVLSPRPGSLVVSYQLKYPTTKSVGGISPGTNTSVGTLITETGIGTMGWAQGMDNHVQTQILRPNDATAVTVNNPKQTRSLILKPAGGSVSFTSVAEQSATLGFTISDTNLTTAAVTQVAPSQHSGAHRIAELQRIYFDEGANRLLLAVVTGEVPLGDKLAYVDPNGILQIISSNGSSVSGSLTYSGTMITSAGAVWQILPFRYVTDPNTVIPNAGSGGWYAICTNRIDPPIVIATSADVKASLPIPAGYTSLIPEHSQVKPTINQLQITTNETANAGFVVTGVQALASYMGSLVIGGFCLWQTSSGTYKDFTNYIAFCDPGKPYQLSSDTSATYTIQVGDGLNEPITAMSPTSVASDTQGINSQLVIFTAKKIRVFTGIPAVSNQTTPTNLTAVATADVGCNAPKTVVRTPHGVVFLGTDGYVYLLDASGKQHVISYALENEFFGLSPRLLQSACATYRLGWYMLSYATGTGGVVHTTPETHIQNTANNQAFRNDAQVWCDMRNMSPLAGMDLGAKWYGPMTNLYASCFANANGPEDFNDLYIGWDHAPVISQMMLPQYQTDPKHNDASQTQYFDNQQLLNEFDMGNPHIEKTVTAVSIGCKTDNPATVTMNLLAFSDSGNQGRGDFQQVLVKPAGSVWGSGTWGGGFWSAEQSFAMLALRPHYAVRGRSFSVEFKSTPPYVIDATNNKLDFTVNGSSFTATIASGTYSPAKDILSQTGLYAAIQTALDAQSTGSWTCSYDIQSDSFTFTYNGAGTGILKWASGANHGTTIGTTIGFDITNDSAALSATGSVTSSLAQAPTGTPPVVSFADIEVRYRPIPRLP